MDLPVPPRPLLILPGAGPCQLSQAPAPFFSTSSSRKPTSAPLRLPSSFLRPPTPSPRPSTSSSSHLREVDELDRLVRRRHHTAARARRMRLPEGLGQLGRMVLEPGGRPALKRRQRDRLRLRRAVGPRARLGEVLLVIALAVVPEAAVLLVVGRRRHLRRDRPTLAGGLERLLVRVAARLDQRLLLLVIPVEARAILRAAVVALAHARRRVVRLPEPPQDVDERDLGRVVHHAHALRVAGAAGARLLVRRVGREARTVADGGGVDAAAGQAPDTLLRAPEAGGDTEAHHQARA
mmetsp:Transcript_40954/g.119634  ORF Transcript_40954/g.119634 Transcript_40954/m.119634 type:complete len:294 (-) Transcript_40954:360-1241(-)